MVRPELDQILDAALVLPESQRAELIARLLNSLGSAERAEIDAAWAEEAERRLNALERGEVEAVPGEAIMRALVAGSRP